MSNDKSQEHNLIVDLSFSFALEFIDFSERL
jgi:hypothetical protein